MTDSQPAPIATSPPAPHSKRFRTAIALAIAVVAGALAYIGLGYLVYSLTHETTDDAFIDGPIVAIAPKVAGIVKSVAVSQNQSVKVGDLLVEIDAADLETSSDRKRSALVGAEANQQMIESGFDLMKKRIETAQATVAQAAADADAAQAVNAKAEADFVRAKDLSARGIIAAQEFDAAKSTAASAAAALQSAREKVRTETFKVEEIEAQIKAIHSGFDQAAAQTHEAQADLKNADLTLGYATVKAPVAGRVTHKNVEAGSYVQMGQELMALVPNERWVTANFKETQLTRMNSGTSVEIEIDALGGRRFLGHVESIQAGSGARFSLLPPENAVGNFVKVVQRVPVKVVFDEAPGADHILGPGMSVAASARVSDFAVSSPIRALAAGIVALIIAIVGGRIARRPRSA